MNTLGHHIFWHVMGKHEKKKIKEKELIILFD